MFYQKRFVLLSLTLILLSIFCSSSSKICTFNISNINPSVRLNLFTKNHSLPKELEGYQKRLDSLLKESSERKKSFFALQYMDISNQADYRILVSIDSIILIPIELQKEKLNIKDSIITELSKRQSTYDSSDNLSTEEVNNNIATATSLLAGPMLGSLISKTNYLGLVEPYPNLSYSEKRKLKNIKFNPTIIGTINVICKSSDTVWNMNYCLEDEYDRLVDYNEQIDMLLRWLIGKMRFTYNTPFISDNSIEKIKVK